MTATTNMKRGNLPNTGLGFKFFLRLLLDFQRSVIVFRYWKECFKIADKNENGKISLKEASWALKKHNVNIKKSDLEDCFHLLAEPPGSDELSKEGFGRLYEMLNPFPMQTQLYEKFAVQWILETMQDRKGSVIDGGSTIESKIFSGRTFRAVSSVTKVFPNISEYSTHLWNTSYMIESEFEKFLIEDGSMSRH
ncbi:uncharacterized protein LOC142336560 isoform X2 [Convolutriloba macropyga]|uniref:uncharacterized protein LOC142336560 isoform X2 n=1 Tax=Convolutriloba macropyga TaxID=536237 RepID=UPI003F51F7F2